MREADYIILEKIAGTNSLLTRFLGFLAHLARHIEHGPERSIDDLKVIEEELDGLFGIMLRKKIRIARHSIDPTIDAERQNADLIKALQETVKEKTALEEEKKNLQEKKVEDSKPVEGEIV